MYSIYDADGNHFDVERIDICFTYENFLEGNPQHMSGRIKSQMTSVEEEMGIPNPDNLVRVLDEEFRSLSQFGIDLEQSSLSPKELGYAEELVRTKYTNKEWLESRKKDESGRIGCFIWKID